MDQSYIMGPIDPKQVPVARRGCYGEEEDMRPSGADNRTLVPSGALFHQSTRGPARAGSFTDFGSLDMPMNDPRYVPQDIAMQVREAEARRSKSNFGYPLATGVPAPDGMANGFGAMTSGIAAMSGVNGAGMNGAVMNGAGVNGVGMNGAGIPGNVSGTNVNGVTGFNGSAINGAGGGMPGLNGPGISGFAFNGMQGGLGGVMTGNTVTSGPSGNKAMVGGSIMSGSGSVNSGGVAVPAYAPYVPTGQSGANVISSANSAYNIGPSAFPSMPAPPAGEHVNVKNEDAEIGMHEPGVDYDASKPARGLKPPIPPLHVQQQLSAADPVPEPNEAQNMILTSCSRCKKDFVQNLLRAKNQTTSRGTVEPKIYKLCNHCRDLQRQRSRRWQKKTKDKEGACRRCGGPIPESEQNYVLCAVCRTNLRTRKASRAANGRCVHCSGPIGELIFGSDAAGSGRRSTGSRGLDFKVCQRCRENDKIRRTNLEKMGNCNRCAKALDTHDQGRNKVCSRCRDKKKKNSDAFDLHPALAPPVPHVSGPTVPVDMVPPVGYLPVDQGMLPSVPMQPVAMALQEYGMTYGQVPPGVPQNVFKALQGLSMDQQYSYSRAYPK